MRGARLVVAALGALVLTGCLALGPTPVPLTPSGQPSEAPSAGIQSSASAQPPSSPLPGSPAIEGFGATTPLFTDTFEAANSGWGTGSTQGGDVEYVDGALQFDTITQGAWLFSSRPLPSVQNVVRVEATYAPSTLGYQGLLCADSREQLYGAVATGEGRWVFVTLTASGADVLATQDNPAWAILPAISTRMALDCAVTETTGFRMQLSLPDRGLAAAYEGGPSGPPALNYVGIYGEATADAYSLRVDDFVCLGGRALVP